MATPSNIDAFLEINDQSGKIKGESLDKDHSGLLQIQNFTFGVEMATSAGTGTGLGAGKAMPKVFEFEVSNSTASPVLFKHVCSGEHCKDATLYIRKAGGKPQDYYIWKFTTLLITKFDLVCSDNIVERVAFSYEQIECEYKPQDSKGALGPGVKAKHNVNTNVTA
jgi:type VI secretion system secreted protein Hcp